MIVAKNGPRGTDYIEGTSRCLDASGHNTGIFTESTDQVLCSTDFGKCHQDEMESSAKAPV